jgi:hypothetical protein
MQAHIQTLRADRSRLAAAAAEHCNTVEARELARTRRTSELEEEVRTLAAKYSRAKRKVAHFAAIHLADEEALAWQSQVPGTLNPKPQNPKP